MKNLLILILLLPFSLNIFAQETEFSADRPGLSDAPDIIPKGSWQIETGVDFSKYNHYGQWQLPTNTLRYGINNYLEARLDFGGQFDHKQKIYGISPLAIGVKTSIGKQKKWMPQIACIFEIYPPVFNTTQGPSGLGMELCMNHDLKNDDKIYYNTGINWNDLKMAAIFNALLGYNHEINNAWQIFGEIYYYSSKAKPNNFVGDAGVTWQMRKRLAWDFCIGVDLVKPKGNLSSEFGIAYNFN